MSGYSGGDQTDVQIGDQSGGDEFNSQGEAFGEHEKSSLSSFSS